MATHSQDNYHMDNMGLDHIFRTSRTHHYWLDKDVPDQLLKEIYDLAKLGATSANCSPMRILFVKSLEAKEKLKATLMPGNIEQTMKAPVTAIIAYDMAFYEFLPKLFPHIPEAKSWFTGSAKSIFNNAIRNGTLQGAYFMIAARACGLDCGPMSGFDNSKVDQVFFKGTTYKSNFLCNLGYGDSSKLHPRNPRFEFDEVCKII